MVVGVAGDPRWNMTKEILASELSKHHEILDKTIADSSDSIGKIIAAIVQCFRQGNKLLLCGNGGSAADAQHIAGEFINRFRYDHAALPAIALTTDTSVLTCIANDSAFEFVFSRQVEALGKSGDILVGISTSGGSPNVLSAIKTARSLGISTIGFMGENGREQMAPLCDFSLIVPSTDTPRVQECHLFVWHYICGQVESILFPGDA